MINVVVLEAVCRRRLHLQGDVLNIKFLVNYPMEATHKNFDVDLITGIHKHVGG